MSTLDLHAMGSEAQLIVVGGRIGLIDQLRARIDELERRWSRFLPDSEVSELNRKAGHPVRVSTDTVELVRAAQAAWRLSGGAVDATLLGALLRAGYDRTFEDMTSSPPPGVSALAPGCTDIVVDGDEVTVPAGVGLDPGGIGKGLAADMVAAEALAGGVEGVCVNLGGDVRVSGTAPRGGPWTVAVEHPWSTLPFALVTLHDGAVATSTTLRRRWRVDGEARHHLIDPWTGQPSQTDLTLATVIDGSALAAEVAAKAVLLRGSTHPFDIVEGTGAEALAVDRDGVVLATPGIGAFLGHLPVRVDFCASPERGLSRA
ncbi:MAG: FAD:protein transferase [Actinomycetota bacterium]